MAYTGGVLTAHGLVLVRGQGGGGRSQVKRSVALTLTAMKCTNIHQACQALCAVRSKGGPAGAATGGGVGTGGPAGMGWQ